MGYEGTPVMIRLNVLGASGCGASTLGRAVALRLGVPYHDSDDYFHAPTDPPFQRPRPFEERNRMVLHDLAPDSGWVLGGGVMGWGIEPEFTHFVFLTVPTALRLERLRRRESAKYGVRILPGGDMHEVHTEFMNWAASYDAGGIEGKTLARHEDYLDSRSRPVLALPGTLLPEEALTRVMEFLVN